MSNFLLTVNRLIYDEYGATAMYDEMLRYCHPNPWLTVPMSAWSAFVAAEPSQPSLPTLP